MKTIIPTIQNSEVEKPNYSQYFKTNDFCLYNGDSLEVLKRFPDNYVDMIFADPPYMLSNNGFSCQNGKMVSVNKGKWDKSKGFEEDAAFHLSLIHI
jgi:site-specific DNA-methyltransferase (adenine-specific)